MSNKLIGAAAVILDSEGRVLLAAPEILECRYCSIDDLPKPISDFTYQRIQDALNKDRQQLFYVVGPRQWIE